MMCKKKKDKGIFVYLPYELKNIMKQSLIIDLDSFKSLRSSNFISE